MTKIYNLQFIKTQANELATIIITMDDKVNKIYSFQGISTIQSNRGSYDCRLYIYRCTTKSFFLTSSNHQKSVESWAKLK